MSKIGRPTKYKRSHCEELIKYFDIPAINPDTVKANDLPTLTGFARHIGVSRESLREWQNSYPEFSVAVKKAKAIQEDIWIQNSLRSRYNPAFTIFLGKNVFGWTDKQEVNHKVSIEDKIRAIEASAAPKKLENVTVEDVE